MGADQSINGKIHHTCLISVQVELFEILESHTGQERVECVTLLGTFYPSPTISRMAGNDRKLPTRDGQISLLSMTHF